MKWRVQIGAGVGDHLDLADMKFNPWSVELSGRFATQVIANDRRRQPFVGHDIAGDDVTEVDQLTLIVHVMLRTPGSAFVCESPRRWRLRSIRRSQTRTGTRGSKACLR